MPKDENTMITMSKTNTKPLPNRNQSHQKGNAIRLATQTKIVDLKIETLLISFSISFHSIIAFHCQKLLHFVSDSNTL